MNSWPRVLSSIVCLAGAFSGPAAGQDASGGGVGIVEVRRGPLSRDVRLVGTLEARQVHLVHAPDLPNRARLVVAVVAPDGGLVRRGQVVLAFDSSGPLRRVRRAEDRLALERLRVAQLRKQQAAERLDLSTRADRAAMDLERADLLVAKGVGLEPALREAHARLDREAARLQVRLEQEALEAQERRSKADLDLARLAVEDAEHDLLLARQVLERLVVRAPADGLVHLPTVRLRVGLGTVVAGVEVRPGSRLAEIHDPGDLVAVFEPKPELVETLPPGTRVSLAPVGLPSKKLSGRVLRAEPICDSRGRSRCRLGLRAVPESGAHRLMPGGTVVLEARVLLSSDALSVPSRGLFRRDGRSMVWSVDDRSWRTVHPGRLVGDRIEIRSGLKVGDRISLDPVEAAASAAQASGEQR